MGLHYVIKTKDSYYISYSLLKKDTPVLNYDATGIELFANNILFAKKDCSQLDFFVKDIIEKIKPNQKVDKIYIINNVLKPLFKKAIELKVIKNDDTTVLINNEYYILTPKMGYVINEYLELIAFKHFYCSIVDNQVIYHKLLEFDYQNPKKTMKNIFDYMKKRIIYFKDDLIIYNSKTNTHELIKEEQ